MKMDSNHIYIQLPYDAKDIAKHTLNGVWSRKQMAWRFPKSTHALDEIAQHFPQLTKTVAWQDVYTKLTEGRAKLKQLKKQPTVS